MEYYAIQVMTTEEDEFIRRVFALFPPDPDFRLFAPKRALHIRKGGKTQKKAMPVFPGYVFLEADDLGIDTRWRIRRVQGFIRFLKDSQHPTPLVDKDRRLLLKFISFGKIADTSKVSFDDKDRIVVHEGPLKGLEGNIIKVDRRRGRARISLDMVNTNFVIDLGFEAIEKAAKGAGASDDRTRSG